MFEQELKLYSFVLKLCQNLAKDIEEEQLDRSPKSGMNSPRWILGHLAVSTDYAAMNMGLPKACSDSWHAGFGMGSKTNDPAAPKPSKQELLTAIANGHERVAAAIPKCSPELLAKPHRLNVLKEMNLHTVGDLLAHLLTTHAAFHLGQLSYWRRQNGFKPLF